jgi:hypothetical protein
MTLILTDRVTQPETGYPPYIFEGSEWSDGEKYLIRSALRGYLPPLVPPTFNEWHFFKDETGLYMTLRASNPSATCHTSLGAVLAEINVVYLNEPYYNLETR